MQDKVKLSVRSLVEYVYRSGSIETGFRTAVSLSEGTRIHQRIQKRYGEDDQKEVHFSAALFYGNLEFTLEGRCDGILLRNNERIIDEIKSVSRPINEINEDTYPVHWAQAKCYAFMYALDHHLKKMTVQLTYVQCDTNEEKRFRQILSFEKLEQFIQELLNSYAPYAEMKMMHKKNMMKSIQDLIFPFPNYREGQRKFAGAVYKTIAEGKSLYANAPTGIGKTISALFPAIKAIGEGEIHRIFYLTAKTITRQAAEEAIKLLTQSGLNHKTVTITAKDKICFKEETNCQKEYCEFAHGYYDRINGAILDLLANENLIDRKTVEKYALKHRVCPFEFSLDAAYAGDFIICDYNYIFDPRVSLRRFIEEDKKKSILLIDEAHNLVDRAREMYSATLDKSSFLQLSRSYKGRDEDIQQSAKRTNQAFIALKKKTGDQQVIAEKDYPDELLQELQVFSACAEKYLTRNKYEAEDELLDTYFAVQSFIRISQLYDERFITYMQKQRNDFRIKLFCLDPSHQLNQARKGFKSTIFFSATLKPFNFYKDMLGFKEDDYTLSIPSPFSIEQTQVYIQPLSTRFRDRGQSIEPIVNTIKVMLKENTGNYLIFFPSYQYMEEVYRRFLDEDLPFRSIIQRTGMDEKEREAFLAAFVPNAEKTLLGFAVMGGIFSEGVDLQGDRINGVFVVGVGLPQLGLERDLMKKYFHQKDKNGYDYAYTYPGMNKVLQAGGRLIRSETDSGIIVLIDDRYLHTKYQELLPQEWKDFKVLKR
ncbi:ATP-dependent DNA helicase [Bacillus sp. ISL-47]|uniref:ATP-dependent DNA helicase n=1 Tax=Bacillus sp. ISL-47 TaxID=2819130 RepID=UPI001BE7E57E|nr:ATP-dependent DNA helicase [Bacillus sp. ISL-47]MBT2690904.1 ATP-dependent DNA helicase [Bacillus sp. ISL-47]MBT2710674.1 ATP-dependent DNA helicase [Pseudomonas sp. ISL-84]